MKRICIICKQGAMKHINNETMLKMLSEENNKIRVYGINALVTWITMYIEHIRHFNKEDRNISETVVISEKIMGRTLQTVMGGFKPYRTKFESRRN